MDDLIEQDGPQLNPPATIKHNQDESQIPPKRHDSKYHKIVDSVYFRIILTGTLMLLLFATAFLIALVSEARKQGAEQVEEIIPEAEVILPTPQMIKFPTSEIDQEIEPYYGHETDDWKDYSKTKQIVKFNIDFPEGWLYTDNSALINEEGVKVVEYGPGAVILKPGQKCDDTLKITTEAVPETPPMKSHEHISIGNLEGTKTIYQATFSIIRYCLQENDRAFVILFYELSPNISNEEQYNQILSTFQFLEE